MSMPLRVNEPLRGLFCEQILKNFFAVTNNVNVEKTSLSVFLRAYCHARPSKNNRSKKFYGSHDLFWGEAL